MSRLFVNLIGEPGAGKTACAEYLETEYGFGVIRPSDLIRDRAKQIGFLLRSRQDYIAVHEQICQQNPDTIPDSILNTDSRLVCIDGLRVPTHAREVKKRLGSMGLYKTTALICPSRVRYERMRNDNSRNAGRDQNHLGTYEEFVEECRVNGFTGGNYGTNIDYLMKNANDFIDTNRNLPVVLSILRRKIEKYVSDVENMSVL